MGITEPIRAMGTNSQGEIYPPPRTTMWFDKSATPGNDGRSIIAGHVTFDGHDVFYNLDKLHPGASLDLTCANGRTQHWFDTSTASEAKPQQPATRTSGVAAPPPVLVIITCDRNSPIVNDHHSNNFLVWAAPA